MPTIFSLKNPHLEAAKGAIDYVKQTVVHSASFANRDGILANNTPNKDSKVIDYKIFKSKLRGISDQIENLRDAADDRFEDELNGFIDSLPQSIKDKFPSNVQHNFFKAMVRSAYAEKYSLGNCGELSDVALKYLIKKNVNCPVEAFLLKDKKNPEYNHTFLVIGRDQKSDPKDYKKWNAIICDPWARNCYSSSKFAQRMCNYEGWDANNFYHPKRRKFDPKQHDLIVETVNIFANTQRAVYIEINSKIGFWRRLLGSIFWVFARVLSLGQWSVPQTPKSTPPPCQNPNS